VCEIDVKIQFGAPNYVSRAFHAQFMAKNSMWHALMVLCAGGMRTGVLTSIFHELWTQLEKICKTDGRKNKKMLRRAICYEKHQNNCLCFGIRKKQAKKRSNRAFLIPFEEFVHFVQIRVFTNKHKHFCIILVK